MGTFAFHAKSQKPPVETGEIIGDMSHRSLMLLLILGTLPNFLWEGGKNINFGQHFQQLGATVQERANHAGLFHAFLVFSASHTVNRA